MEFEVKEYWHILGIFRGNAQALTKESRAISTGTSLTGFAKRNPDGTPSVDVIEIAPNCEREPARKWEFTLISDGGFYTSNKPKYRI